MKKLLSIIFLSLSLHGIGQMQNNPTQDASNWNRNFLGVVTARKGLVGASYTDTASANADCSAISCPKGIPFIIIFTTNDGHYWYRNLTATAWIQFLSGTIPSSGWLLIGNSGTNSTSNWIGTNDDVDWVIKRFGTQAGLFRFNSSFGVNEFSSPSINSLYGTVQALKITSGISPTTRYTVFDPSPLTAARSLRIPDSSGTIALLQNITGGTQDLQQVTDIGANTTHNITKNIYYINKTTWPGSSLPSDYTAVGSPSYTVSGGKINLTGSTGTFAAYIRSNLGVLTEANTLSSDVIIAATPSATSYGFAIGYQSYNTHGASSLCIMGGLNMQSNDATHFGKPYLYSPNNPTIVYGTTANTNINSGDTLNFKLLHNGMQWSLIVKNNTQSWSVRVDVTITAAVTPFIGINSSYPAIYNQGGSYGVENFSYTVNAPEITDMIFVGNSITYGNTASLQQYRWINLVGGYANNIGSGGSTDVTQSVVDRLGELIAIKPRRVFLYDVCGNDIAYGVSSGTWQANLITIRDSLVHSGIEVVWANGQPRTGTDETAQKTFIEGQADFKGDLIIDTWTPLLGTGTDMNPIYTEDGTHPNNTGGAVLANVINIALGYRSVNTFGSDITTNGLTVGFGNNLSLAAIYNTAVGVQALNTNTTGQFNTGIGYNALKGNTTGNENTAVGLQSLYTNTTGLGNTAVGETAGFFGTSASYNTSIGDAASQKNVVGIRNTAVGYVALENNLANENTAVGFDALLANTSGATNIAVGSTAGYQNTSGSNNIFIGYQAGNGNTTGSGNVIIGSNAGSLNVSNHIILYNGIGTLQAYHNATNWFFNGGLLAITDNAADIGNPGATRFRTGYFGTSVIAPAGVFATSVTTPLLINTGTLTIPTVTGTLAQYVETSTASSVTPTPTGNARENFLYITAQAAAAAFAAPSGTPANGNQIVIRIKDDGTARGLTYNSIYRASSDLALPSTTVLSKTLYLGFIYNITDSKWDLVSVLNNF